MWRCLWSCVTCGIFIIFTTKNILSFFLYAFRARNPSEFSPSIGRLSVLRLDIHKVKESEQNKRTVLVSDNLYMIKCSGEFHVFDSARGTGSVRLYFDSAPFCRSVDHLDFMNPRTAFLLWKQRVKSQNVRNQRWIDELLENASVCELHHFLEPMMKDMHMAICSCSLIFIIMCLRFHDFIKTTFRKY